TSNPVRFRCGFSRSLALQLLRPARKCAGRNCFCRRERIFMAKQKFVICSNANLTEDALQLLKEETSGHELFFDCEDCSHADIAFGQPNPRLIVASKKLRWMHITSAGYARYDTDEIRD